MGIDGGAASLQCTVRLHRSRTHLYLYYFLFSLFQVSSIQASFDGLITGPVKGQVHQIGTEHRHTGEALEDPTITLPVFRTQTQLAFGYGMLNSRWLIAPFVSMRFNALTQWKQFTAQVQGPQILPLLSFCYPFTINYFSSSTRTLSYVPYLPGAPHRPIIRQQSLNTSYR